MDMPSLEAISERPAYKNTVEQQRAELVGFWKDGSPELNLNPGSPLYSNMAAHEAESQALNLERCEFVRKQSSLYELINDPSLADEEAVDRIVANHPTLRRRQAQPTRGYLAMIMPDEAMTIVPRNSVFARNGLRWRTEQAWVGKPGNLTETTNRLMTRLADGTWIWTFPVVAERPGDAYNLQAGMDVTWVGTRAKALKIYAESDFVGGLNAETLEEMAERLDSGLAAPGMAGRINIEALLRREFNFILDVSQIGGADVEMRRDGYNALGLKVGGKSDIYVRTSSSIVTKKFEISGSRVDGTNQVQLFIGRDVFPGFYSLVSVKRLKDTDLDPGLTIAGGSYSMDTAGLPYDEVPEMQVIDARYSRYQTLLVRVVDDGFDPANPYYAVTLSGMPYIAEVQDFVSRRDIRDPNNDVLIKAPIPVMTAVNMTVEYVAGDLAVDKEEAIRVIKRTVNGTKFEDGKLSTSLLNYAVQRMLPGNAMVKPSIDVLGRVIYPGSASKATRTTTELEVETVPEQFTSPRTASFFAQSVEVTLKLVKRLQI